MSDDLPLSFESFLVEDVILTLGNVRSSLGWIGADEAGTDPARHRIGIDRLDRQIALLEQRARDVCRQLRAVGAPKDEAPNAVASDGQDGTRAPLPLRDSRAPENSGGRGADPAAGRETEANCIETAILGALRSEAESDGVATPVFRSQRG